MTSRDNHRDERSSLSAGAAARLLGVHVGTVRRWADSGTLPSWRTPGGFRRFEVADLERLKDQGVKA